MRRGRNEPRDVGTSVCVVNAAHMPPLADLDELPRIDTHTVTIRAAPEVAWDAAWSTLHTLGDSPTVRTAARLLACDPSTPSGGGRGCTSRSIIPGFWVALADPPRLLVLRGTHRFSRYGIVLRLDPSPTGVRCEFESRASFPGVHGTVYRLAVIGSRGHVCAVRRLLRRIQYRAEHR